MTRRFRHFGGGLDRRDRADDRKIERGANVVKRDRRGGVAGDDRETRMEALHQPAEQGRDAACDLRFRALAVREAGIVCCVDDRRVGQQLQRRAEHRQAADAGIEEKDGRAWIHGWCCGDTMQQLQVAPPIRFATQAPNDPRHPPRLGAWLSIWVDPVWSCSDAARRQGRSSARSVPATSAQPTSFAPGAGSLRRSR